MQIFPFVVFSISINNNLIYIASISTIQKHLINTKATKQKETITIVLTTKELQKECGDK